MKCQRSKIEYTDILCSTLKYFVRPRGPRAILAVCILDSTELSETLY